MTNPANQDRLAIQNLQDALVEDILEMSDDTLLADSREIGMDVEREAEQLRQLLERSAAKARMAAVKADMARYSSQVTTSRNLPANSDNELRDARLTLAARNGIEQTEADVKSVAEDLAALAAFKEKSEQ